MIVSAILAGPGASAGYSFGDWVIQAAPIFISVVTAVTGIANYKASKAALKDPIKLAMAKKIEAEANSLESVMKRFDSVIDLANRTA